ncbi:hypothetical protein ACOI1C_20300 [Bacillus sp. DJP31]|uniref:hypothetical protein n=1 Tax=Bacillus sp. DJP31 TaxID=3409789 RepID=UPI003BB7103F
MKKRVIKMSDLTSINSINFCNNDYDLDGIEEVIYDHEFLETVEPFGMLLAGSKIRELFHKYPKVKFKDRNYEGKTYASHMGFFKSVLLDYGKKPGEASGSSTYIPITEINVRELKTESYKNSEVVQQTIERKSIQLAKVLARRNTKLQKVLSYSIRELIRNIVEHSESNTIWYAGQYWSSKDRVEIAILDEGVGIRQAISFNPNLKIADDKDALLLAIEPGISGRAFKYKGKMRRQEDTIWKNSGYGLYVTSSICQLGGDFLICSGDTALVIKKNALKTRPTNFKGTAIRLRLKVSTISNIDGDIIDKIVTDGERKAKENSDLSVISASKVSRMLTIDE